MANRTTAQDVMRCDLCQTVVAQMFCEFCQVKLCKGCIGEHVSSDLTKPHTVVGFYERRSSPILPKCTSHNNKTCELHCKECNSPLCTECVISHQQKTHQIQNIMDIYKSKQKDIEKSLENLENMLCPKYEKIASELKTEISNLDTKYSKLITAISEHGEDWHNAVDILVNNLKSKVQEMKTQHLKALRESETEIQQLIETVHQVITDINNILGSNDISQSLQFKPSLTHLLKIPPKITAVLPTLSPKSLPTDQLSLWFGSLSSLAITSEQNTDSNSGIQSDEHCKVVEDLSPINMKSMQKSAEDASPPVIKQLLDEPQTITTIQTEYTSYLYNVACLSDEEIWTSGNSSIMKLYSINQGSLLKSISTKSGTPSEDIAVTNSGDLVYTDNWDRTVNIVKNKETQTMIKLQGWRPCGVCSTSSSDLLVIMKSEKDGQFKVVRYSGSTDTQTIQFDDQGRPLYSSGSYNRYITENRNLDICVADSGASAVVVVNQVGKLRFRYTGHTPAPKNKPFYPLGITTDIQSHILSTDDNNHCVHIIDQDGQFLRYIHCGLSGPWGLCIDSNNNLFVAQQGNKQVKKIKYMQ